MGSPTIDGTGIDVGKPPVQKTVGRSLVILQEAGQLEIEGKKYGPFAVGDLVGPLPDRLVARLRAVGRVGVFDYRMLAGELTA